MGLALNNLQRLICHETKPNQTKPIQSVTFFQDQSHNHTTYQDKAKNAFNSAIGKLVEKSTLKRGFTGSTRISFNWMLLIKEFNVAC